MHVWAYEHGRMGVCVHIHVRVRACARARICVWRAAYFFDYKLHLG